MSHRSGNSPASPTTRRWWIPAVYLLLILIGIPWYWPADDRRVWFGMPAWTAVALAASVLTSAFTAFVIGRFWPDDEETS